MIDTYDGYQQVDSVTEILGPGNRWYEARTEAAQDAPPPQVLGGETNLPVRTTREPLRLRLVKVAKALMLPGRLIVNTATDQLLYDSLRDPVRSEEQLDARTRERLRPTALDRQLDSDRLVRLPGTTYCAAVRSPRQPYLLLETLGQLWAALDLDVSGMHVALNRLPGAAELLEPLGVDPARIVELTGAPVFCEELLLATPAVVPPRRITTVFRDVVERIRDAYLPPARAPRRVYVSREGAEERVLLNEPEVEERFRAHGFEVVAEETLAGAEAVRRLGAAEWVAGTVGTGVHAVFAPRDVNRLVLAPDRYWTGTDSLLSTGRGPAYVFGTSLAADYKGASIEDWSIDPQAVGAALEELLGPLAASPEPAEEAASSGSLRDRARARLRRGREAREAPIEVTVSVPTQVSPEALFDLLDDLRAFTRAETRLKETGWVPDAGLRPGARAVLETSVGWVVGLRPLIGRPEATVIVEEVERPSTVRLSVEAPVANADVRLSVAPGDRAGHVVHITVTAQLAGVAAVAPLDRGVRRAARRYAAPSLNRVAHSFIAQAAERQREAAA